LGGEGLFNIILLVCTTFDFSSQFWWVLILLATFLSCCVLPFQ
jgi:hypothetical protein